MITDEEYKVLADEVYKVDKGKVEHPRKEGEIINNSNLDRDYEILKVEDNTDNGMQAMAVASIVNGKVDTSQVMIAYAGTNQSDSLDIATDIQIVGGGSETLNSFNWFRSPDSVEAQSVIAQQFAKSKLTKSVQLPVAIGGRFILITIIGLCKLNNSIQEVSN